MVSPCRSFLLVSLLTLSTQLLASTIALKGQFRVNESGAATYTLPIETPTARGGIKPNISIGYNSSLKTGRLGVGVTINAGSIITRCQQTFATDNQLVGVDLTESDRFCLDGQRLILTSGVYGSPWSTYRKEIDDYSVVTVLGQTQGGGPSAFKVETKDGDVHYYGEQSSFDSQDLYLSASQSSYDHRAIFPVQTDSGEVALNWGIKATVDPFGNYISYQYYLDDILGEHYLSGISYGGHISAADSKPYRQVIFNYKNNPKPISGYVAGRNIAMASLLDSIVIQVDGVTQYKYFFQYQSSNVIEEKTYLLNIKKCVASSQQSCSTQVQFDWTKPAAKPESKTKEVIDERTGELVTIVDSDALYVPFKSQTMTNLPTSNSSSTQFFDIDGDGRGEMIFAEQSRWVMADLDTGDKQTLGHIGVSKKQYARTINYDGDGHRDLLVANSSNSDWYVITLKPSTVSSEICEVEASGGTLCLPLKRNVTYSEVPLNRKATGLEKGVVVADQDGDGLEDIIFFDGLNLNWYKNLGGSFAPASTLFTFSENEEPSFDKDVANAAANLKTTAAFDSNGDGRTDLLVKVSTRGAYCKVGDSNIPSTVVGSYSECVGDLGGVWREYTTHTYKLLVAEGGAYSDKGNLFGASEDSFVRIADVNGDGLVDILYPSNNRWYAKLATGVGYTESIDTGIPTSVDKRLQTIFVDLNQDGRVDILTPTGSSRYSIYMSHPLGNQGGIYWQFRGSLNIPQGALLQFADTYGNGSLDLYVYKNSRWYLALANANKFDHTVHTLTDGYGVVTQIEYSKLTTEVNGEPDVYKTQYSSAESNRGNLSFIAPISVVKSVSTYVSDADKVSIAYEYGGFAMNRLGRGMLGFELLRTIDRQSGVISETTYHQTFPLIGIPKTTLQTKDGQVIKHSKNVYNVRNSVDASASKQVTLASAEEITNQVGSNGTLRYISRILSEYAYDEFGNAESIDVSVFDSSQGALVSQTTTYNEYLGEGGGAEKGRLSKTTVSKSRFGQREIVPTLSRTSVFSYALGHSTIPDGVLVSSTVEPNNSQYKMTTQYAYDKYGNNTKTSLTAATTLNGKEVQTRTIHKFFGENGRYLHSETNALGETKRYFYNEQAADQVKGIITRVRVEDANKRSTIAITDLWGRKKQTLSTDGVATHYDYEQCSTTGCNNVSDAYIVSTVSRKGSPIVREYTDKFGRRIASQKQGFAANKWITTSVEYDNQGRVTKQFEPSYLEKSRYHTELTYDEFSRLSSQVNPDGSTAYSYYYGLETLAQDSLGHQTTSFKNALGEVVRVSDNRSNSLDYVYDAYGNLIKVYISGNGRELLRTSSTYDSFGRKIATEDLDQGKWSYEYNAFGELKRQTDAKGLSTEIEYDKLGRQVRRWDSSGTSCWIYGSPTSRDAGLLTETRQYSAQNQICSAPNFQHRIQYHYDDKGRKEHVYTHVGNERHQISYVYDSNGRVSEVVYPDRELSVRHRYNSQGYLFKLDDKVSGEPYQTIKSMDARGQITNVHYGNGVSQTSGFDLDTGRINNIQLNKGGLLHELNYQFDSQGNLTWRDIKLSSATVTYQEDYGYDDMYRMESRKITISSGAAKLPSEYRQYQKFSYDDFGNLTFKSGVGTYNYDSQNPFKLLDICSDGVCNITESKPASKSCPSGYQLSGTNCIKNEAKVADKSYTYSCPAGYSRSGNSCRKTENKSAKTVVTESCPAGYAEPNCEKTEIVMSPRMPTHPGYRCTGGEPAGWGGNRIWECTVSADKIKETSYQCDTGWSLSGTLCSRTVTKNATKHTHYSCNTGWSLSGSSCKRTLVKPISYA
ncbi:hypothetical protein VB10N_33180 [Vibrio sp. 10N]|nr:hypothetical protein VB10N_33180 [Vibrio sp. 10N]